MIAEHDHVIKDPPHLRLIAYSILLAYGLTLLPFHGLALYLAPNWVLLVLVHWWLRDPWRIGQGVGFLMGLFLDIAMTGPLGVAALSMSIAAWGVIKFRSRLLSFSPVAQGIQMLPVFFGVRLINAVVAAWSGQDHAPWLYFLGTVFDLALWIPITLILHLQDLKLSYRTP